MLRHELGSNVAVTAGIEEGYSRSMDRLSARPDARWERSPYALASIGLDGGIGTGLGWLRLDAAASLMQEDNTVLGARFGPALGTGGARSLFIDLGGVLEPGSGWRMAARWRQGWTRSASGGVLPSTAMLRSNGWSFDMAKIGVTDDRDVIALRISQPLRVERGQLNLTLPDSYDYTSGAVGTMQQSVDLAPRGRELDAEASYVWALPVGWMTSHVYVRRQAGNIRAYPDDIGAALRFGVAF